MPSLANRDRRPSCSLSLSGVMGPNRARSRVIRQAGDQAKRPEDRVRPGHRHHQAHDGSHPAGARLGPGSRPACCCGSMTSYCSRSRKPRPATPRSSSRRSWKRPASRIANSWCHSSVKNRTRPELGRGVLALVGVRGHALMRVGIADRSPAGAGFAVPAVWQRADNPSNYD